MTVILLVALGLIASSCTAQRSAFTYRRPYPAPYPPQPYGMDYYYRTPSQQPSPASPEYAAPDRFAQEPQEPLSPRAAASLQLTEQARKLLEQGKPDDAITVLERAVGLDSTNGQNYYYLAEAWILKDNKSQAEEFNRLAGLYLSDSSTWMVRVSEQRTHIDRMAK